MVEKRETPSPRQERHQVLVEGESGDPSSCGPQLLVRGKAEYKVLPIARKFINNDQRKNRSERIGHD